VQIQSISNGTRPTSEPEIEGAKDDAPIPTHGLGEHPCALLWDRLDLYSVRAPHEQRERPTVRRRKRRHRQCKVALCSREVSNQRSGMPTQPNNARGRSAENRAKPYVYAPDVATMSLCTRLSIRRKRQNSQVSGKAGKDGGFFLLEDTFAAAPDGRCVDGHVSWRVQRDLDPRFR
jgi:hypothetical protein